MPRAFVLAAALLLHPAAIESLAAQSRYAGYREGVFLRFLNATEPGIPRTAPPTLSLSLGGKTVRAVMDTGSTGVVVAATLINDLASLRQLGPGTLTYSSSGRIMRGQWVVSPVTIGGADGARVTMEPMPVLAVERIDCLENARNCEPSDNPRHVAMLGVGFGRERDHQGQSTPDRNPLLNLPGMGRMDQPGAARRGYVVTREGVHVGLTAANTKGDYRFVKLAKAEDGLDWAPLPACVSLDESTPACGSALIDTGVTTMYLTTPADRQQGRVVPAGPRGWTLSPGTRVSMRFGGEGAAEAPGYGFTVADSGDPAAPAGVVLVDGANRPTFVNTSVYALNVMDYLFDADGGYVAFRLAR